MKTFNSKIIFLILLSISPLAWADAELTLYSGDAVWDMKERITISTTTGQIAVQSYKKACSAYMGCKAVQTGIDTSVTPISANELRDLKNAISRHNPNAPKKNKNPKRVGICDFYNRFSYQTTQDGVSPVPISDFKKCKGSGANTPQADTIETIINSAAANAGL
jgi:23S rRNA maturation mini-RNase III